MTQWKLIACDLDGTLVGRDHGILPADKAALHQAREAGLTVAIATGRNSLESLRIVEALELEGPGVFVNGAILADMPTGRTIQSQPMAPELLTPIIDMFGSMGHAALVLTDDPETGHPKYFLSDHAAPHRATREWLLLHQLHAQVTPCIPDPWRQRVLRIGVVVDLAEKEGVEQRVAEAYGTRLAHHSVYSAIFDCQVIEIFGGSVTKWSGLEMLCRQLGINSSQVVTFGDDLNDIAMLQGAALSFAMGQSNPRVWQAAKEITRPQSEAGVALAIQELLAGKWN